MCNEAFSRGFPKGDWYLFVYFDTCSVNSTAYINGMRDVFGPRLRCVSYSYHAVRC
jgi:hypothetical protein